MMVFTVVGVTTGGHLPGLDRDAGGPWCYWRWLFGRHGGGFRGFVDNFVVLCSWSENGCTSRHSILSLSFTKSNGEGPLSFPSPLLNQKIILLQRKSYFNNKPIR
ncbi:hypothetical protein CDAR_102251 [Caerostris darwini]|uniref:Secreted protein n=1 Tax=Caerostris darwini TaxID=1538125 RepID=A0AAV4RQG5_9ARAC|nr:hypothetical protein CDAR_102251 [Caerostris darwini]